MLKENHRKEWVEGSGVSEQIAKLAVESLATDSEIARRLNLKRWIHGEGFYVQGVDPLTGEPTEKGAQFKPDRPMPPNAPGKKPLKYQSAYKRPASPLFLGMADKDYWLKIRNTISIPIWLTEGGKKAGALLTRAIAAISVSGVWNGQKKGLLLAELSLFAAPGRTFILAFDADWRTNINVRQALRQSANLLKEQGCIVAIASWKGGKGIDDYLVGGGKIEEVELTPFDDWVASLVEDPSVVANNAELLGLDPNDEVGNTTFDAHCYKKLFGEGLGAYITIDDSFYRYENQGYWKRLDDREIHSMLSRYSMRAFKLKLAGNKPTASYPFGKAAQVKSAFDFCRNLLSIQKNKLPNNEHLLCFQNGAVDVRTGQLQPHDRNHYLISAIASSYEPNEECPVAFLEFLENAFGSDLIPVIRAVTSMLLDPTAAYGKFPYLVGASGSGKGTLLSVWEEIIGLDHYRSSNDFGDFATPEMRHQNLSAVRLYSIPDIGGYITKGIKPFYSLVDNEPLSGRALFSANGYQAKWNCRFAVASVEPLKIENSGDGWDRRAIPLPTKHRTCPADPTLKSKLAAEKGAIVSWALALSKEDRNYILNNLHEVERIELARTESSISGDPIRYFVDTCLRPNSDPKVTMAGSKLHTYYQAFAHVFGFSLMSHNTFISRLKSILPAHYKPRRKATAESTDERPLPHIDACWSNIQVLEDAFEGMTVEGDMTKCIKSRCKEGGLFSFSTFSSNQKIGYSGEKETEKMQNLSTVGLNGHAPQAIGQDFGQNHPEKNNVLSKPESLPNNGSSDSTDFGQQGQDTIESKNNLTENAMLNSLNNCISEDSLNDRENSPLCPNVLLSKTPLAESTHNPAASSFPVVFEASKTTGDYLHTSSKTTQELHFVPGEKSEKADFNYEKMQSTTSDTTSDVTSAKAEFLEKVEVQEPGLTAEEFWSSRDESLDETS